MSWKTIYITIIFTAIAFLSIIAVVLFLWKRYDDEKLVELSPPEPTASIREKKPSTTQAESTLPKDEQGIRSDDTNTSSLDRSFKRSQGDIALKCKFSDGSGSESVLIFSDRLEVKLMADLNQGDLKGVSLLRKVKEDNIEIVFRLSDPVLDRINPNHGGSDLIAINRESLKIRRQSELKMGGAQPLIVNVNYACDLMDDEIFRSVVTQVINARDGQQARNKI